jgi:DNA-binding FadR family transcriptional regulator
MQARVVLESGLTSLAAVRASPLGLASVQEALEEMRGGLAKGHEPLEADRRFHLSIAELGGNSVLVELVGALFDGRCSPIPSRMNARVATAHSWQSALDEHEAILRALKSRDPQAAAAQMCRHLQSSHRRQVGESMPSNSPSKQRLRESGLGFGMKEDWSDAACPPFFWPTDSAPNQTRLDGYPASR